MAMSRVLGRNRRDISVTDVDFAVVDRFESGEHPQRCRFFRIPTGRRAQGTRRLGFPGQDVQRRGGSPSLYILVA